MSGYAPGTIRVWNGSAWVYQAAEWQQAPYEFIKQGTTSSSIATTTTCSRTPGTVHKGDAVTVTASTTGRGGGSLDFYFRTATGSWSKIASKAAPTAGGTVSVTHTPGSTGYYYATFTGSTGYQTSSSAPTSVTTVQTLQTTTIAVNKGWHQAYTGWGDQISGSGRDNAIHQGYYSSTYGNRKSLIRFNTGLPSDAAVSKVLFVCNNAWPYWDTGGDGTIVVGSFLNQDTKPTSWVPNKVNTNRSRKSLQGSGISSMSFSIDISSWACSVLERSDFSGLTIGPGPSTSADYFGYSKTGLEANDFQLIVTYSFWA